MADRPADHPRGEGPRLGPGVAVGIDEAMIRALVHAFYGRVRRDEVLGPIFEVAIGDSWAAHLAKLRPEHFGRWLALFVATAADVCPPAAAALFVERSRMIGRSLELGLAVSRGELPPMRV